jgi:hypothetical protein
VDRQDVEEMLDSDGGGTIYGLVAAEGNLVYDLPQGLIEAHTYKPDELNGSGFRSIASGFRSFFRT